MIGVRATKSRYQLSSDGEGEGEDAQDHQQAHQLLAEEPGRAGELAEAKEAQQARPPRSSRTPRAESARAITGTMTSHDR